MFSSDKFNPLGRFDGLAPGYARHRPQYPAQALDWILEAMAERAGLVADVGAGTGIMTRQLAERGCRVIGIEPNASMLEQAEAEPRLRTIEYRSGQAEATGLPANSVAAVVAAQTFHWCEADASLREFHRILKPAGAVTLLWNIHDRTDPFTEGFWRTLHEATPEPEIVDKAHHLAGQVLLTHPLFEQARLRATPNEQALDEEGLLGRAFSASFAPKDCQASARAAERLRELFHQFEKGGRVHLRYQTHVYQARRKDAQS